MEKKSREKMGDSRFLFGLVVMFLCISEINGQDVSEETATTVLSEETTPVEGVPIISRIQFPKDRVPSGISTRIIGGSIAAAHEYPYQVALYITVQSTTYFCGGTLITNRWVLTAAHCVDQASLVQVVLGAHNRSQAEADRIIYDTETFIVHSEWDESILQNDIALIRLPENVTLTSTINTVQIAQGTDSYAGISGRCLGWGKTLLGVLSTVLRYVDVEVITNKQCSAYDEYTRYIVDHHLCTSGAGIVGSCNGDSGGPLVIDGVQVGIVSFGVTDCAATLPSVFTRITEFHSWISDNIESWNETLSQAEKKPKLDQGNHGSRTESTLAVYAGVFLSVVFLNNYL